MTLQDHLDQLVTDCPDVTLAAFGDLASGLVLKWSARGQCPREILEQIGAKAAAGFAAFDQPLSQPGEANPAMAPWMIHFTATSLHIAARHADHSEDLVFVACAPGRQIAPHLSAVMALADEIASLP